MLTPTLFHMNKCNLKTKHMTQLFTEQMGKQVFVFDGNIMSKPKPVVIYKPVQNRANIIKKQAFGIR